MDLEHLRAFAKVVRLGSLTKAAASLGVPKSTISRRLADLENQLGTRLVQRTTRRLSATDAGYRLFQQTEPHLLELEAAARNLTADNGELGGTLRITTPTDLTTTALIPVIQEFMDMHPKVKVGVLATNRRVDLVAEGVDVALRAGKMEPSTLIARRLVVGEFRLFASEEYLRRKGTPKQVNDLLSHDCVAFGDDQTFEKWTLRSVARPSKVQDVMVRPRLTATSVSAITRACTLGMGIAFLPNQALSEQGPAPNLRRVLPQWCGQESVLHVVYPAARHMAPTVRAFIDHIVLSVPKLFA